MLDEIQALINLFYFWRRKQFLTYSAVKLFIILNIMFLPFSFFGYRVNGVKINYFPEQWSWICSKRLCTSKLFELKSSVQFIQVPVIWHYQNTSKFWILQRLNLCEGDICWSDIFYPFTHMKDGDQVAFATMWGLTLIPCGLYLIWFLRSFW